MPDYDPKACEIYKENCEHFRSLNTIMWRIPTLGMMLNGGLWFGVAKLGLPYLAHTVLLSFAAICNFFFIIILLRVRDVMDKVLKKTLEYEGIGEVRERYTVVTLMSIILGMAGIGNCIFAFSDILKQVAQQ